MKKLFALCAIAFVLPLNTLAAERIVSIGGDVTEIIYKLGKQGELVGTDTTSYFPAEANKLPKVGYMRMLSAEGILALKPTLIVANQEAGPPPVLAQLKQAGVKVNIIPKELVAEGVAEKFKQIATAVNAKELGETQAAEYLKSLEVFKAEQKAMKSKKVPAKVLFLMNHGKGGPMVSGAETPAESIIKMAGGENALSGFTGLRPVSPEAVTGANPDVLIVSGHGFEGEEGKKALLEIPGIASTEAATKGNVLVMDTLLMMGFGPRTPEAAKTLSGFFAKRR